MIFSGSRRKRHISCNKIRVVEEVFLWACSIRVFTWQMESEITPRLWALIKSGEFTYLNKVLFGITMSVLLCDINWGLCFWKKKFISKTQWITWTSANWEWLSFLLSFSLFRLLEAILTESIHSISSYLLKVNIKQLFCC